MKQPGHTARPMAQRGVSVVELLVVMVILGIILSFLTAFFSQSTQVSRRTQAFNEVRVKVRTVAELVMQDLQMAGSSALVDASGNVLSEIMTCSMDTTSGEPLCLESSSDNAGSERDFVRVRYATSLRDTPTQQCRVVSYSFAATAPNTLLRADYYCDDTSTTNKTPLPFADNITKFDITYLCADYDPAGGATNPAAIPVNDPQECRVPWRESFARQVVLTVAALPDAAPPGEPITAEVTMTTFIPNLKDQ